VASGLSEEEGASIAYQLGAKEVRQEWQRAKNTKRNSQAVKNHSPH
jgi:hypothetical protein